MGYIFLSIALVLNALANTLLKISTKSIDFKNVSVIDILTNWALIFGLLFFVLNVIFYILALSKINLSVGYPIMAGGGIAIIVVLSSLYLGETITLVQWGGIISIVVGIILISSNT